MNLPVQGKQVGLRELLRPTDREMRGWCLHERGKGGHVTRDNERRVCGM